jgi:hypothetical protein
MDTFASAQYTDEVFWNVFFKRFEEFTAISTREPMLVLNFLFLNGKKMLRSENGIYNLFTGLFEPTFKQILLDRDLTDYLIKINFMNFDIDTDTFNKNISNLFINNDDKDVNNLSLYFTLMKLLDKVYSVKNLQSLKIMSNILIDLIKVEPNSPNANYQLKLFFEKLKDQNLFKKFVNERIAQLLIYNSELSNEEESRNFENIFYNLKMSGFMDKIDIARLNYKLREYPKLIELINKINENI